MGTNDIDRAWKNRVLCSDEGCIGVIGPDGNCKECGRPFEGELPANLNQDTSDNTINKASAPEGKSLIESDSNQGRDSQQLTTDDDWSKRTLCSDESCIGVIGPDGRCKECEKPYSGSQ